MIISRGNYHEKFMLKTKNIGERKMKKATTIYNDGYKYRFSVIIPVYNVEDYLEETILSVVEQTMDFKANIQLILINDG